MSEVNPMQIHATGEATGFIPAPGDKGKPITVIGTNSIRAGFDATCLRQALNARSAPGVSDLVLNPDAHAGYGAPVGCVLTSQSHVYPGPVGVDIKCSMSFLQLDLPAEGVADKRVRRALIDAILERTPTGPGRGQRSARKARKVGEALGVKVATDGAAAEVLHALGIPGEWAQRCEDAAHVAHDGTNGALAARLEWLRVNQFSNFLEKISQLGSYGGGNHFGECEVVQLGKGDREREVAEVFGLRDGCVGFLSHCGSRGFGHALASGQFRALQQKFAAWNIPLPGEDKELVYAPLGTPEADSYLDDMALGANFATVNHLLINALVLEAFQEIIPGVKGSLVYFISHNIARKELLSDGHGGFAGEGWVHRKGATRAFPAKHPSLKDTPFAETGHPILLPGNPAAGSVIMVAAPGAEKSAYSVNHGAGRCMGRKAADRALDQKTVDDEFVTRDILTNCRQYPKDEAPAAYKDFDAVLDSVKAAGLASEVARLKARFVIKDADASLKGAA
ncbi:MAG TPA: RtcB family protein [Verrucomicrobiae bacterium]|nr:RtcB family protein [Verrucomicrobiae bacterium]